MRDTISLNEMRDRAGRAIFGNDWLGGRPDKEWAIVKSHGPKKLPVVRLDGTTVWLPHINPCPPSLARKLDEALGRAERAQAQFVTVDTWIQEHVCLPDPHRPAARKTFNAALRAYEGNKPGGNGAEPRGPKPLTLKRIVAEMRADVDCGKLSADGLRDMKQESLAKGYGCSRETAKKARRMALTTTPKNKLRQTPTENK